MVPADVCLVDLAAEWEVGRWERNYARLSERHR